MIHVLLEIKKERNENVCRSKWGQLYNNADNLDSSFLTFLGVLISLTMQKLIFLLKKIDVQTRLWRTELSKPTRVVMYSAVWANLFEKWLRFSFWVIGVNCRIICQLWKQFCDQCQELGGWWKFEPNRLTNGWDSIDQFLFVKQRKIC